MPGLLRGMARTAVVAGTATAVSNRVSRRQADRWNAEQAAEMAPAPDPSDVDYQLAQLEKLSELKKQGILSQAEFDQKKSEILGL